MKQIEPYAKIPDGWEYGVRSPNNTYDWINFKWTETQEEVEA